MNRARAKWLEYPLLGIMLLIFGRDGRSDDWTAANPTVQTFATASHQTKDWTFNVPPDPGGDYALSNPALIEVAGGVARLVDLGGGTYTLVPQTVTVIDFAVPGGQTLKQWYRFYETLTLQAGTSVDYQLSNDNGVTWYYWNPAGGGGAGAWEATAVNYTAGYLVDRNIRTFPIANSRLRVKSRLTTTVNTVRPILDNLQVEYVQGYDVPDPLRAEVAASAPGIARLRLPGELAANGNTVGLWHLNTNEGVELPDSPGQIANTVGLWHFREAAGTTAGATADTSGSGNNGTLTNITGPNGIVTSGKFGNGLSLDGANDYVRVTNNASLNFGAATDFSVEAWVRTSSNSSMEVINKSTAIDGGDGSSGAFNSVGNANLPGGTYNYTTFTINAGHIITVTGATPLIIKCQGAVVINGTLVANGGNGATPTAGTRGPGGYAGGAGGVGNQAGSAGSGPGGGGGTPYPGSMGAGGGFGGNGGNGNNPGGGTYNPSLSPIEGGSGGGGGASRSYSPNGGGGGGGGGAIKISAGTTITLGAAGIVQADGGRGGNSSGMDSGAGGGGSGGGILLEAAGTITNGNQILARGGAGGNGAANWTWGGAGGGGGRVIRRASSFAGAGTVTVTGGAAGTITNPGQYSVGGAGNAGTSTTASILGWQLELNTAAGGANTPGNIRFILSGTTGTVDYAAAAGINDGRWHHIVVTVDRDLATGLNIFRDGVQVGVSQNPTAVGNIDVTDDMGIGAVPGSSQNTFNGRIDEVAVYSRAIVTGDITDHYNRGRAADRSPFGNNGDTYGPLTANGRLNGALTFEGSDDFVTIPDAASLGGMTQLSVEAWVYLNTLPSVAGKPGEILVKKHTLAPWLSYELQIQQADNKVIFNVVNALDTVASAVGNTALTTARWYHIAGVYDGTNVRLYVDGVEDDPTPGNLAGTVKDSDGVLNLGASNETTSHLYGRLDEAAIVSYALTAAEVADHAARGAYSTGAVSVTTPVFGPGQVVGIWNNVTVTTSGANNGALTLQAEYSVNGGGLFTPYGAATAITVNGQVVDLSGVPITPGPAGTNQIRFVLRMSSTDGTARCFDTDQLSLSYATGNPPNQPTNAAPGGGDGNPATAPNIVNTLTPTLSSSAFGDLDGSAHAASQRQITAVAGNYGAPTWDSGADAANLISRVVPAATLADGTTYYWRVRYQDNTGLWSVYSAETSFLVDTTAPAIPTLVSPGNGTTTSDTATTFLWTAVADLTGTTYDFQLSTDAGFGTIVQNGVAQANNYYTAAPALTVGQTYWWRVRSVDGATNTNGYSGSRSVTIVAPGGPNNAPVLTWSAEAGYGADGVNPNNGTTADTYTYKVVYTDQDNNAPTFVRVQTDATFSAMALDGLAAAMLRDGNYANGEQYVYATASLASGNHTYRFEASDGISAVFLPAGAMANGPAVALPADTTPPAIPVLLSPGNGAATTETGVTFVWSAVGDPSGVVYDYQISMDAGFTVVVQNGAGIANNYVTAAPALTVGSTYYWRAQAVDGAGNPSGYSASRSVTIIGPGGTNNAPVLTWSAEAGYGTDGVNPNSGTTADTYVFKVVYTDADNNPPASLRALIDSTLFSMVADVSAAGALRDGNYTNGEQYVLATASLAAGNHTYRFEASDGYATAFLPAASIGSGPVVSLTADLTPPASPAPISPDDGSATMTTGVTFVWENVNDPSGVTYDIQVGRDAAFADVVQNVVGLTNNYYTASPALTVGTTYYWRVRARDGAGNASAYSTSRSVAIVGPGGSNTPPTLAYAGETGYGSDGVNPDSGDAATNFTFKIVYTDADNNAPAFVRILLDDTLATMSPDPAAAASLRDGNYANGEQYVVSSTGLTGGVHAYRFEASDGYVVVFLPSAALLNGPDVVGTGTGIVISTSGAPLQQHEGKTCFIGATVPDGGRPGYGGAILAALLAFVLLRAIAIVAARGSSIRTGPRR